MRLTTALALSLLPLALGGCIVEETGGGGTAGGPGSDPWNHDEHVACATATDCGQGEVCEDGVCQMARCVESYQSLPPMGANHFFGTDAEVAIIADDTFIDAYESTDGGYLSSWDLQSASGKIVDVAGGDLDGKRPHTIVAAIEMSSELQISGADGKSTLDIGIWPKALAIGDVDADGVGELVAFADDGAIALCDVDEQHCAIAQIQGAQGKDVAVGDVDGDGYAEPMFLFDLGGETQLVIWNPNAADTGEEQTTGWKLNMPVRAFAAGQLDGTGPAETVLLEDGGWWGWTDDKLHVFSPSTGKIVASHNVSGHTTDVATGDRNSDEQDEIVVLRDNHSMEMLKMQGADQLISASIWQLTVGQSAQRISMLDWDGDSASGRLTEGPELVAGKAVPVAALMFPPFPYKVAVGALSASITLGDVESTDETMIDTLSLGVGLGVSFGAETPLFKAKVGGYLNQSVSVTKRVTKSFEVGARYWILAQPDLFGASYAPVILSCGCYHRYRYQTEDPAGLIGGTGQQVDVFVPVGGQTQLWSSKRYNAMAEATGTLPVIEVPVRVGDVTSYPTELQTLDGQPIAAEDVLFPFTPTYQISDVGFVSFWLSAGESETNEVAETTTIGVKGSFGVGPVSVDTDVNVGVTQGYSIHVGKSNLFAGSVPPVPDDPSTPEDEYEVHRYSFTPVIYRQHYVDVGGEDAAFYVMHFAVGP